MHSETTPALARPVWNAAGYFPTLISPSIGKTGHEPGENEAAVTTTLISGDATTGDQVSVSPKGVIDMRMRITGTAAAALILVAAIAAVATFLPGALNSGAVQNPTLAIDMIPADNTYDETTNTMTVAFNPATDFCLATDPANPAQHNHNAHVIVQNVEDLVGWQVRLNYAGDQFRPNTVNFTPFTDNTTGQNISFNNLPIDQASSVHRDLISASSIPPGAFGPQTAAFGATYIGPQDSPISPDTPAKTAPDDTSYRAPSGGVLASVIFQVVGDQSGKLLFLDMDDGNPNGPGSGVAIFDGTQSQEVLLPESSLGDASHGEDAGCQPPTPTPTPPPPTPTPPPETPRTTAMPTQQPACQCFDPQLLATYSSTAPGSHPDIAGNLDIGLGPDRTLVTHDDTGDYNFAGIVNFSPSSPTDADVPDAAILGTLNSISVQGLLNNPCVNEIPISFTFMEATTDITNTVDMLEFGLGNELALMAGDNPPFEGAQAVRPPPAVTKYPSFLNAIFDHDWVDYGPDKIAGNADDNNGPQPPIKPRFRAVATTYLGFASLWMIRQELVFEPGTRLPNLPAFDPALGHPSIAVFQTSSAAGSATPPIAGPITDACTPIKENSISFGVTGDNPDTPADEGGVPLRTLPAEPGISVTSIFYAFSQRDADRDGYENAMDPCPFHFDATWNPRDQTRPIEGDSDKFAGQDAPDGIPDTCDPTPNEPTGVQGGNPRDHDGDGFPNSGDNCPMHYNPDQADRDRNAAGEEVGDGIGDVCDTPGTDPGFDSQGRAVPDPRSVSGNGPLVPDGDSITCVRTLTITVGGPSVAAVSDCTDTLPPVNGGGPQVPAGCVLDDNDFDNDGITNRRDKDDDNDGIRDGRDKDDDNDGIRDNRDPDDDNDGIPDRWDKDDGGLFCPDDRPR